MEELSLAEIAEAAAGNRRGPADLMIDSISTDSRTLAAGDLFIALIGDNFDGHEFVADAFAKGAKAAVVSREIEAEGPLVMVDDTTQALQDLANYYRRQFSSLQVVAVTGSTGKTTTKDMIASVLEQKYKTLKSKENFNNEIGLPLTLFNLDSSYQALVVEMGMRGLGEIRQLARIAEPRLGVITNVGVTHIELLGSQEKIAEAKSELIQELPASGLAVLNGDDQRVAAMKNLAAGEVITYGLQENNRLTGINIHSLQEEGVKFRVAETDLSELKLPVPGEHNVYNALAAVAVGRVLNVEPEKIKLGLEKFSTSKYRQQVTTTEEGIELINDAYNANPTSMQAALNILEEVSGQRKIAVLGDMLELGAIAEKEHRRIGKLVADKEVDYLLTVGELGAEIAAAASEAGMEEARIFSYQDNQEAGKQLLQLATADDTVLVKASRGMKLEEVASVLQDKE